MTNVSGFHAAGLTACSATVHMPGADLVEVASAEFFRAEPKYDQSGARDVAFAESDLELKVLLTMSSGMQHRTRGAPGVDAVSYGGGAAAPQWSHRPLQH